METNHPARSVIDELRPNNFFGSRINGNLVYSHLSNRCICDPTTSSEVELMETKS